MSNWDNPMVKNALKALSPEDVERYKKMGESLYGKVNFTDSEIIKTMGPVDEAVAYVEEGLKSGLLPSDLDENEVILLTKTYGEKWYERYGFSREDVPEEGLPLGVKSAIDKAVKQKIKQENKKKKRKRK